MKKSSVPNIISVTGSILPSLILSSESDFAIIRDIKIVYNTTNGNIPLKSKPSLNVTKHIEGIAMTEAKAMSIHDILVKTQKPIEYNICAAEKLASPRMKYIPL